jgi:serine/threonine protein kinase
LHRDIKPSNIYLTKGGVPILLDFGAARLTMHGQRSRPISVVLTPGFAPFEQYLEKREFGPTLDIYGVGATLYYLLTGRIPPPAMLRVNKDDLIPPMQLNTAISSELNQAVMRALSVEAEKRPQSIDELCALLFAGDPKRASEHGAATPANPAIPPPAPPPSATLQVRCPRCKARNPIPRGTKPRHVFCSKCGSRMATSSSGGQPLVVLTGVLVVAVLAISLWQPKKLTSPPSASEEPQTEVAESEAEAEAAAEIISATSMQAPVESPAQPIVETPTQQMPTYSPPPRPEPRGPALGDRRSPPQGRAGEGMPPYPPPQNAIDACKNKQTEDACELLTPDGQIEGLCRQIHDYFACIPDKPPL